MIRRPPRSTRVRSSAASDVYKRQVLNLLDTALDAVGASCLFISHDLAVVSQLCERVLVMLDGDIVEQGTMAQVFNAPNHPYTRGLVATARLDAVTPGERLPTVEDFYARQARR